MTYDSKTCWNYYVVDFFQEDFLLDLQNYILDLNFLSTLKTLVLNGSDYTTLSFLLNVTGRCLSGMKKTTAQKLLQ